MSPDARYLLAALQRQSGPTNAALETLPPAQWLALALMAVPQRVGPLLYDKWRHVLPDEAARVLAVRAKQSAQRGLYLQSMLRKLGARLTEHAIPAVALKGLHVALLYPTAGLREMNDVDVLVEPHRVDEVAALARELGFTSGDDPHATHHHAPLILGQAALEIHWQLSPDDQPPLVGAAELMSRSIPLPIAGLRGLCPEDLVIHLCAHAADGHVFAAGLRAVTDIQILVDSYATTLNWQEIVDRARRWRALRAVGLVTAMARQALAVPVPPIDFGEHTPPADLVAASVAYVTSLMIQDVPSSPAAAQFLELPDLGARLGYIKRRVQLTQGQGSTWQYSTLLTRRTMGLVRRHSAWLVRAMSSHRDSRLIDRLATRRHIETWLRSG